MLLVDIDEITMHVIWENGCHNKKLLTSIILQKQYLHTWMCSTWCYTIVTLCHTYELFRVGNFTACKYSPLLLSVFLQVVNVMLDKSEATHFF